MTTIINYAIFCFALALIVVLFLTGCAETPSDRVASISRCISRIVSYKGANNAETLEVANRICTEARAARGLR